GAEDLRAAREEAGPVERDRGRDGRRRDRPARRPLGDEGALPHVRARPPGRHQLLVGERHGAPVDAELPGELARRRQLRARCQQPLVDEWPRLRRDWARRRRGLVAVEWDVHGVPASQAILARFEFWSRANWPDSARPLCEPSRTLRPPGYNGLGLEHGG